MLAGNTSDSAVLPQVKDDLRAWRLGRVVTVVDRGFSSAANLDYVHHLEAPRAPRRTRATTDQRKLFELGPESPDAA